MKKAILYGIIAAAALSAPALTSCLSSETPDGPSTFTATLNPNLNFTGVKEIHTGEWKSYAGGTVRYLYDFQKSSMQFGVSGMAIAQGENLTFTVPSIPLTFDNDGAWVADHHGPFTVSGAGQTHVLTDLKTYIRLPQNAASIVMTEFTIDGEYLVRIFPNINYFGGDTRVYAGEGVPLITDVTYYDLFLDQKTMTAELFSFQSKFTAVMPAMNLVYPNLPFVLTDEGLSFSQEDVLPYTVTYDQHGKEEENGRKPFPAYTLSEFSGKMAVAGSLEFSCTRADGRGKTTFSGTPLVEIKK